jgi:hypothetical protein
VRDPVLAAEEDGVEVDPLHARPRLKGRVEDGGVVRGGYARVVEEDVDASEALLDLRVGVAHRLLVGHVEGQRELALGVVAQVDPHDHRALGHEARAVSAPMPLSRPP